MASPQTRNNRWFVLLVIVVLLGGFVVIGYWQSYDIKCTTAREWNWRKVPPQFVCRSF